MKYYEIELTNSKQNERGETITQNTRKVKGYRIGAGYTQNDLAKKFGYSRVNYSYKERGIQEFTEKEKEIMLRLFKSKYPNLTMTDLFD